MLSFRRFATFIQHVGVIAIGVIALFIAGTKLGVPVAAIFAHGALATSAQVDALQTTGAIGLAVGFVWGRWVRRCCCCPVCAATA